MARFFINRPIFAWVIAIVIMLAGLFAVFTLPISQYPTIAPPSVSIRSSYPGADATTVERSVTQIIEQNMTGLDGYMYMSATSDSYGNSDITITFEPGTNPDIAQVQVQNKLQQTQILLFLQKNHMKALLLQLHKTYLFVQMVQLWYSLDSQEIHTIFY